MFLALLKHAWAKDAILNAGKGYLTANAVAGLGSTFVGLVVAFIPSRQVNSIWIFEGKLIAGCVIVFGAAFFFYQRALHKARALRARMKTTVTHPRCAQAYDGRSCIKPPRNHAHPSLLFSVLFLTLRASPTKKQLQSAGVHGPHARRSSSANRRHHQTQSNRPLPILLTRTPYGVVTQQDFDKTPPKKEQTGYQTAGKNSPPTATSSSCKTCAAVSSPKASSFSPRGTTPTTPSRPTKPTTPTTPSTGSSKTCPTTTAR